METTWIGRRIIAVVALAAAMVALYYPTLRWLVHEWWSNDYYTHGPLVLLVAGILLWRRRAALRPTRGAWPAAGLIVLGMGIHLGGLAMRAYYLSALSFPILTAGLIAFLLGAPALRAALFPLGFLCLAIPLPFVELASMPLQTATASVSTWAARVIGIPAQVQGAQISLPSCELQVGAACSGLRSLVALLTLVVLFTYLIQGEWWQRGLLLLLAIPIAIGANFARVIVLLVIAHTWGREAGLRYFHDFSSPVLFLVAFMLLITLSRVLRCGGIRSDI